ncbi:hypothetical protein SELMODRAFT_413446 [Selaginella moellendorffii]|uniref:Uncharacterized protein n=1 Tax=Selaginella moellendorffii TaxID=88036 RepID=D8RPH5_SELML|nr:hypothetical protein SELMODRAFT_413446 [Selaginella moellendorffii]
MGRESLCRKQLPITAIERLALAVQPKECLPLELSNLPRGVYIVWSGELALGTGNSSVKILSRGGFVTQEELQGATASGKVVFLVLNSADAALIHTKHIWTPGGTSVIEKLLQLEKVEIDVYRGFSNPNLVEFKQIFGGQLVGQALAAASKSVNPFFLVHSLHSYFLFPGDKSIPIIYRVQRIRDGYNFANRSVSAFQSDQIIFTMTASFRRGESGAEHQLPVPCVPPPEEPKERFRMIKRYTGKNKPPFCILAYASDWIFLESALRPHGWTSGPTGIFTDIKVLSMDHSWRVPVPHQVPSTPCGEQSFTPLYQPPKLTKVFILNITPA